MASVAAVTIAGADRMDVVRIVIAVSTARVRTNALQTRPVVTAHAAMVRVAAGIVVERINIVVGTRCAVMRMKYALA